MTWFDSSSMDATSASKELRRIYDLASGKDKCDAMRVAASQIIRSLNASASNNLRSAKLFVAPASQVPAYCISSFSDAHL